MTAAPTAPARASFAGNCLVCGTALAGLLGAVLRLGGVRRSAQNPNLCNRCDAHIEDGRVVELAVFFVDLSGYTGLTSELGPDRMAELLDRFLRLATEVINRWDGFVTQFVGDEVMAFFNVPLQRPDFGARAVGAASELQERMAELREAFGLELRATIGVAAGHARVGRVGSEEIRHYSAIGDVVNRAARLVARVEPDGVLVDDAIYGQVAERFPEASRETVSLKGFDEPVEVAHLRGSGGLTREPEGAAKKQRSLRVATALAAVLGAPCAGILALSPVGAAVGVGSFGLSALLPLLDQSVVRIPLLALASLGGLANLAVVFRGAQAAGSVAPGASFGPTKAERGRTRVGIALSAAALGVVVFELIAHRIMH